MEPYFEKNKKTLTQQAFPLYQGIFLCFFTYDRCRKGGEYPLLYCVFTRFSHLPINLNLLQFYAFHPRYSLTMA